MSKTILFVIYGGGHAHMVCPVVHQLRTTPEFKSGAINLKVLALPAAKRTLDANGIECLTYRDYVELPDDDDALEWGNRLAEKHHSPSIGIDRDESVVYLGLNFKDLVLRYGMNEAERLVSEKGRHAFFPVSIMERIFDRLNPDVVVTSNSPRSEAAAIEVALRRGIQNLSMTDLFTGAGGYKLNAQNITFINEFAKNKFLQDGRVVETGSRYYYTGNPAFDKLLSVPKEKDDEWLLLHFIRSTGRTLVLHADTPAYWHTTKDYLHIKSLDETLEEMEACYQAARAIGAMYLLRPHPSQDRELYAPWLATRPDAYLAADCDLKKLLLNVDLVIVRSTTVGIEAAYLEKRIIQLDPSIHSDLPLVTLGLAVGNDGYRSLSETMRDVLIDDANYEVMKGNMARHLPRMMAAPSISKIILDLAGE